MVIDLPLWLPAVGRLETLTRGFTGSKSGRLCLAAPKKTWIWFENSAHSPPFEEPEAFVNVLVKIQKEGGSQ